MADKNAPGLRGMTVHTNVFGTASRHVVSYAAAAAAAGESVALMPLPPGMRIDGLELRVTDAAAGGDLVSIGHERKGVSAAAAFMANQSIAAVGSFHFAGKPIEIQDDDRFLIVTFPNAVAAAFDLTILVDYVFVGND